MAKIGRRRLARGVVKLLAEQPNRHTAIMRQLAGYMVANKLANQADLLLKDIADEMYAQQGHISAEVAHAFEMTQGTLRAIEQTLKNATGATSVELQSQHDPALIGGVVIRTPRQELDASVRSQLKQIVGGSK